jgi:LAS superfamily LD-carboxypeptidase LdcB
LFNSSSATEHIYQLALDTNYKFRNRAGSEELDGTGKYAMKKDAKKALRELVDAAIKDKVDPVQLISYQSPEDDRKTFESEVQKICNSKFKQNCTAEDLSTKKYDEILNQVLTSNNVPNMSIHSTGLAVDVSQKGAETIPQFKATNFYKWMKEDNYFNIKRFGFFPNFPEGVTQVEPFVEDWQIYFVGKEVTALNEKPL